jgi:hypothetical protein
MIENDSSARSLGSGGPRWCDGNLHMAGTEEEESRNRGEYHPVVLTLGCTACH